MIAENVKLLVDLSTGGYFYLSYFSVLFFVCLIFTFAILFSN